MVKLYVPEDTPYKAGDKPPRGQLQWFEWAAVQVNAGLPSLRCKKCKKYFFPQEYEDHYKYGCKPHPKRLEGTEGDKQK